MVGVEAGGSMRGGEAGYEPGTGRFWAVGALMLLGLSTALWAAAPGRDRNVDTLTIGAYSVIREALQEGVLPAFRQHWKERTGRDVRFEESYSASGAQARAIASGFDADVALLSLEGDVDLLVKAGVVAKTWNQNPQKGMISRSLVVIGVRDGNPHAIADWSDLTKPEVSVLYPDPKTSGGARWNINAIYGAGLLRGESPGAEAARELLQKVQARVVTMDASGRQSMATFERGTGDAVVTYENELLLRRKLTGSESAYVIPPATLLIESPAALVETSVARHGNRELAEAFLAFLGSEPGQAALAEYGFRPLNGELPPGVFTMAELGGWSKIKKELYDRGGLWDQLFTRTKDTKAEAGRR